MKEVNYYGDTVRSLLIGAGVIMIVTLPFFTNLVPKPLFISTLAVLLLILLSGFISPIHKNLLIISVIVSALAFLAFEYYSIEASQIGGVKSPFFIVNQILALMFLSASYFGTKSVRWLSEKGE